MLSFAFRNLFARPARNVMTGLSVMMAMGLVTFVVAARTHARDVYRMLEGRNNLLIVAKDGTLPLAMKNELDAIPQVKRTIPNYIVAVSERQGALNFVLHGTFADYATISDSWFYVEPDVLKEWESQRDGFIVGRETAKALDVKPGDRVQLNVVGVGPVPLHVIGISPRGLKASGGMAHYDYIANFAKQPDRVTVFWSEFKPGSDTRSVARDLVELHKNGTNPIRAISASASLKSAEDAQRVVPTLLTGAGTMIILATILVTANTIAFTLRERTAELATLRAIGFKRRRLLALLMLEVLIVCLSGGAAGALAALVLFRNGVSGGKFLSGSFELQPILFVWVLGISAALAIVTSFIPALRASRMNIVTALRER